MDNVGHTRESEATGIFAARCNVLGIPTWRYDGSGMLRVGPIDGGAAGKWLASASLRGRIDACVKDWLHAAEPGPVDLFPGCTLVPFTRQISSRRLSIVVALLLAADAAGRSAFDSLCAEAGVACDQAWRGLTGRDPHRDAHDLLATLRWMHDDLMASDRDLRTLDQFSEQLAHAYEEINLLYGLGRSMGQVSDPRVFLKQTLDQLLDNLPFGWVAAKFVKSEQVVPVLSDHLEIAGTLPCDAGHVAAHSTQLLMRLQINRKLILQASDEPGLPATIGSEVVTVPITHDGRLIGALLAGNKGGDDPDVSSVETKFLEAAADFLGVYHENAARYAEQRTLFFGTLRALTASIDAKDRYTCGHSERVGFLAEQLALRMGMNKEEAEQYRVCGLVHDVGKIGIAEAVLRKPGRLTAEEFEQIKQHPSIGYEILKDIPPIQPLLPGVLYHHERWDGKGYPQGLKSEEIPLIAVVIAAADMFDAMSSNRAYRDALPREKVFSEIDRSLGEYKDPCIAALIRECDLETYDRMLAQHQQQVPYAA